MKYVSLIIKGKEFKLRIGSKVAVELERKTGKNPAMIMQPEGDSKMPTLESFLLLFHAALQKYHHGYNMDKVYDIYDAYVEEGKSMMDFMVVIMEVLYVSGYMDKASFEAIKAELNEMLTEEKPEQQKQESKIVEIVEEPEVKSLEEPQEDNNDIWN